LHPEEEHRGQLATIGDDYGAEDYGALADEVFKREVFHPGAHNEILADIGVVVPGADRAPKTQDKLMLQKRCLTLILIPSIADPKPRVPARMLSPRPH